MNQNFRLPTRVQAIDPEPRAARASMAAPTAETSRAPRADLLRNFNTALISTKNEPTESLPKDLCAAMDHPAFRMLLNAVQTLAEEEGIPESEAATQMIQTFRNVDRLWSEYVYSEGLELIKRQLTCH